MTRCLRAQGHPANRKRIQRLMRLMGATMLATLQRLGVMPSFSRPSVSNDNPYSESLFKTLKYTSRDQEYPVQGAWIFVESKA